MDGWQQEIDTGSMRQGTEPAQSLAQPWTLWTMICSVLLFLSVSIGFYVQTDASPWLSILPWGLNFHASWVFLPRFGASFFLVMGFPGSVPFILTG